MEILPNIHRISGEMGDRRVAFYLLIGRSRSLLLDTGIDPMIKGLLLPYCEKISFNPADLDYVVVSHSDLDHSGGNAAVRDVAPNAVFACHASDKPWIEDVELLIKERYRSFAKDDAIDEDEAALSFIRENVIHTPIDLALSGGETIALGDGWDFEVLHLPGHSRGHIGLYDKYQKTLLAQDAVLGQAVPFRDGKAAFPPTYRYRQPYLQTIARIEALAPTHLLTCHYSHFAGEAVGDFLAESRNFDASLYEQLMDAFQQASSPLTMKELCSSLGPKVGNWGPDAHNFLCWPLTGMLEEMQQTGLIEKVRSDSLSSYKLKSA